MRDELTGLNNSRYFKHTLPSELYRAERYKYPLSLMVIDIYNFKSVNDIHGHLTGDKLIKKLGNILSKNIRQSDTLCRYGGDEFVIIFPMVNKDTANIIKKQLSQYVSDQISIRIDIGVSSYPEDGKILKTLFNSADRDMYRDKGVDK
jgi:diguanylate cyclase (GGDEF)-like protein